MKTDPNFMRRRHRRRGEGREERRKGESEGAGDRMDGIMRRGEDGMVMRGREGRCVSERALYHKTIYITKGDELLGENRKIRQIRG